jgi:RNA polymerase sigma-70 factor (ECF subfamily)
MSTVTASPDRVEIAAVCSAPAESAGDVLVAALRRRDENTYLELVRRYTPLMVRVARLIVGSGEAAEDVVQDTWIAVLRSVDGFEGRFGVQDLAHAHPGEHGAEQAGRDARTVCWSTQPGDASVWDAALARRSTEPLGPLECAIAGEAWEVIRTALAGLPDRQRLVVVLRDVEGSTSEEVRALLGVSAGNQRVLLHRGRARLRELLTVHAVDAVGA